MSFYARKMVNRPSVTFGSQRSARQSHTQDDGNPGGGGNQQRERQHSSHVGNGGGGASRYFQPQNHRQQQNQQQPQQQRRQAAFSQEDLFEEVPIEGSIHAHEDDMRNFSQVTLSQLSNGSSVRSMRSHRSSSQRSAGGRGGGGGNGGVGTAAAFGMEQRTISSKKQIGSRGGGIGSGVSRMTEQERYGSIGGNNGGRSNLRGPRDNLGRGGGLKLPERTNTINAHVSRQPQQQQQLSQSRGIVSRTSGEYHSSHKELPTRQHNHEDDDNGSLKSSQPLLSQCNDPTSKSISRLASSNGRPSSSRPSSSGRNQHQKQNVPSFSQQRMTSSRPTSRGRGDRQDSRMHHEDDNSTIQSQPLLSPLPGTSALPSMPPRRLDNSLMRQSTGAAASGSTMSQREQQQQQPSSSQFRTPGRLSNLPSLLRNHNSQTPAAYSMLASKKTPYPPSSSSRRPHSTMSSAVRTVGAISGTLASLPTPSRAFRSISSLAVKTTASLAGMSPFRRGRIRSTLGSTLASSALASSTLAGSSATPRSTLPSSSSNTKNRVVQQKSSTLHGVEMGYFHKRNDGQDAANNSVRKLQVASPSEKEATEQVDSLQSTMDMHANSDGAWKSSKSAPDNADPSNSFPRLSDATADVTHDRPSSNPVSKAVDDPMITENMTDQVPASTGEDVVSKLHSASLGPLNPRHDDSTETGVAKCTTFNEGPQEDLSAMKSNEELLQQKQVSLPTSAAAAVPIPTNHKTKDDISNHQDEDDIMSKTSGCTLDIHGKAEELIAATRELKHQHKALEKTKQEFVDMNERARQEWKGEYAKLETLQECLEVKFQSSMALTLTRIASSSHENELALRTLANKSLNELRQESSRAMEGNSNRTREMKVQLPSEVRALVEAEARKYMEEMMGGMVAAAKSDFQQWADGVVKSSCCISDRSVGTGASSLEKEVDRLNNNEASGVCEAINECERRHNHLTLSVSSEPLATNDNVADDKGAHISAGSSVGDDGLEKENMEPDLAVSDRGKPAAREERTPTRFTKPDPLLSNHCDYVAPDLKLGDDGKDSPESMSTATTPFSRKATPLQNNYAKNRLSDQVSTRSRHHIDLDSELRNDHFSVVKSPFSSRKASQYQTSSSASDVSKNDDSSTQQLLSQSAATPVRDTTKTKVSAVKKASLNEPKHRVKAPKQHVPSGPPKHARVKEERVIVAKSTKPNESITCASRKTSVEDSTAVGKMPKTKQSSGPPKKRVRKRDQSNTVKSPRRSKRLKEGSRVEQMAIQVDMKLKPNKVTPKEDRIKGDDARDDAHLSVICNSASETQTGIVSNGFDSLLGTSVTVPTDDKREDELIGFDESEDAQPDRRSLAKLLPFCGFRSRKGKTMSKKKGKKVSSFSFDFS